MPNRTDGNNAMSGTPFVEIKSKFDAEFRRFSVDRMRMLQFVEFYNLVCNLHKLDDRETCISYSDRDGDLLPINNDSNLAHALSRAVTNGALLRLVVQRKGDNSGTMLVDSGRVGMPIFRKLIPPKAPVRPRVDIGQPISFRPVSAIIDVDLVPATHMRVKLMKNGSDRPLGFYIRDGVSLRVTPSGVEKVPSIFISRLVPGGLAQHTGLLSVGDEVLEVNGIDVTDKTLDQVTDMMIANASNLIITVKPANQQLTLAAGRRNSASKNSKFKTQNAPELKVSPLAVEDDRAATDTVTRESREEVTNSSLSQNGGSQHSITTPATAAATVIVKEEANSANVVDDASESSDSDLEPDEVRIHDDFDDMALTSSKDAVTVEHHQHQSKALASSHDDSGEDSSPRNSQSSPFLEVVPSTTAPTTFAASDDSVLRI